MILNLVPTWTCMSDKVRNLPWLPLVLSCLFAKFRIQKERSGHCVSLLTFLQRKKEHLSDSNMHLPMFKIHHYHTQHINVSFKNESAIPVSDEFLVKTCFEHLCSFFVKAPFLRKTIIVTFASIYLPTLCPVLCQKQRCSLKMKLQFRLRFALGQR